MSTTNSADPLDTEINAVQTASDPAATPAAEVAPTSATA